MCPLCSNNQTAQCESHLNDECNNYKTVTGIRFVKNFINDGFFHQKKKNICKRGITFLVRFLDLLDGKIDK